MSYSDIVFAELQKFWDAFDDAFLDQNAAYIDTGSILNIIELFTNRLNSLTEKEKKVIKKIISEPLRLH